MEMSRIVVVASLLISVCVAAYAAEPQPEGDDLSWIRTRPRRIMVGLHTPDYDQLPESYEALRKAGTLPGIFENLDVDDIVKSLKEAHVQAFWFYAKGGAGNAFYPSEVGHAHTIVKDYDLFGELCEKCMDAGITPLCVYEGYDARLKSEHPDWCAQPVEMLRGERDDMRFGVPCAWGSDYGDFLIEQTREILTRYPVKGYYVDAIGGNTRNGDWMTPDLYTRFREEFGFDFAGLDELTHEQYVRYYRWRLKLIEDYLARVREVVKELRPDVAFTYNYVGIPGPADFITCDIFPLKSGTLNLEYMLRRNAALSVHKPGEALLDGVGGGEHLLPKGLDGYRAECWMARSLNVAVCTSFIMPLDGRKPAPQFELTRRVFAEQKPFEEFLTGMEPVSTIGIFNSHDSRKFRPGDEEARKHHLNEFQGWVQAAAADGYLWDFLDEYLLSREHLDRFDVVVAGNASCMSASHVEALRQFVRAGGTLILSGEASLFDRDGNRQPDLQLADVAGVHYLGTLNPRLRYAVMPADDTQDGDVYSLPEGQVEVRAVEGAESIATAFESFRNLMMIETGSPAIVFNHYGKGRCIYLAGLHGAAYATRAHHTDKEILSRLLALASQSLPPVVRRYGADTISVYAHRQRLQNRFVVNLVNHTNGAARTVAEARHEDVDDMPPVPGATVILNEGRIGRIREVYLAPDRTSLEIQRTDDGRIEVSVPQFDVHAMIVAELE